MPDLTDRDKDMLTLAGTPYVSAGRKEAAMRDRFDLSATLFWQRVDWLLEQAEAEAWDAQLVNRLRRLQAARRRQRSARARLVTR